MVVAGVDFDAVTFDAAVARIDGLLANGKRGQLITTPNPEMVIAAQSNAAFRDVLASSSLAVPDGIGIIWASYFLSLPKKNFVSLVISPFKLLCRSSAVFSSLPARVTGTDLLPAIFALAARRDENIFLLGAAEGVAEAVAEKFSATNETLRQAQGDIVRGNHVLNIVGTYAGSPRAEDEAAIIERINASGATILFVAYGAPAQELWLARNLPKLSTVKIAIGVGGAFDFHAGRVTRAPRVFRALGLEWLWRLIREPRRLPRIWNATGRFIALVWRTR